MTTKLKLSHKSRHGRNRIAQHGEIWIVIDETPEELKIRSERTNDERWIFKKNDPDFSFTVIS